MYEKYKKDSTNAVDYNTFVRVLKLFGAAVRSYILKGLFVNLPFRLGSIKVFKKPAVRYVDYPETKRRGKVVFKDSAEGYKAKIVWDRRYARRTNRWQIIPYRGLARGVINVLKMPRGHTNFVEKAIVKPKDTKT